MGGLCGESGASMVGGERAAGNGSCQQAELGFLMKVHEGLGYGADGLARGARVWAASMARGL